MLVLDRDETCRLLADVFVAVVRHPSDNPSPRSEIDEAAALLDYLDDGKKRSGFGARLDYEPEFAFPMTSESQARSVRLHVGGSKYVFLTLATHDGCKYNWIIGFGKRVDDATTGFLADVFKDWLERLLAESAGLPRAA
jgi:hypothetical protein